MDTALLVNTVVSLALLATASAGAQDATQSTSQVVEIRSYNLKPGARDQFHQVFEREALPMLRRWKVDVVAYGPSLHDNESYFLIRGFPGVEERQRSEDAFYASDEWRQGPREAVLAAILSYTTIVVRVDESTLKALRRTGRANPSASAKGNAEKGNAMHPKTASPADLDTLIKLNEDYIRSVQTSDVRRFEEILADDFLCSLPDGSLVDRARFLEQTARPVSISDLAAHDVNVRLMGDFAIIHARTTYKTADGGSASGRYTDVWARRNGRWLAVSAHVTRN